MSEKEESRSNQAFEYEEKRESKNHIERAIWKETEKHLSHLRSSLI